jgi:hypothetical protein
VTGVQTCALPISIDQLVSCINESVNSLNLTNPNSVKQVVLVTNFKVQHSAGSRSIPIIESLLMQHADRHKELEVQFKNLFNITYRRIYYSAIAVSGFRLGGLTPLRQVLLLLLYTIYYYYYH